MWGQTAVMGTGRLVPVFFTQLTRAHVWPDAYFVRILAECMYGTEWTDLSSKRMNGKGSKPTSPPRSL